MYPKKASKTFYGSVPEKMLLLLKENSSMLRAAFAANIDCSKEKLESSLRYLVDKGLAKKTVFGTYMLTSSGSTIATLVKYRNKIPSSDPAVAKGLIDLTRNVLIAVTGEPCVCVTHGKSSSADSASQRNTESANYAVGQ